MKRKIFLALTLILAFALCFSLASCGDDDETVKSVEFVKGSTATEYTVGATPDFSGIQLKVTYEDDHTETVGADKLTIGTVDTSTAGEKTLTVKYGDFSVDIKITVKAAPATITGIAIVPGTAATTVKLGTVYDVSTVQVEAVYSDGTKKPIAASDLEIIAPSTAAIGEATLKVKYLTYEATLTVTVTGVSSIVVDASSVANEVYIGGVLDTSKLKVIVTYSSGETKTVERELLTIGNVDTSKIGDASLPIAYDGFTYNYPVKVYGPTSLVINESSVTKEFFVGATAEFSGIQATVFYSNNTNKTVYLRDLTLSAVSTATAGTVVLTATYETVSDTVNIAIVGVKDMSAIGLASEILVGEVLNLSALKLNVTYTNNKTAILESGFTVGSFDSATKGNKTLAITYLDKTINAPVKVCGPVGLVISNVPTFVVGQKPSLSGLAVSLLYEDSLPTTKPVTTYTTNIDSLDFDLAADKTLTVTYEGFTKDVILSTSTPRAVSLVIADDAYAKHVAINHEFVTASISATLNYNNGTYKELSFAQLTVVSAINTAIAGEQTLKVSYTENGDTVTEEITVTVCTPAGIKVVGVPTHISATNDINEVKAALVNMKVYLYYKESGLDDELVSEGYETNVDDLDFSSEAAGYSQTLEVSYQDYDKAEVIISTSEPVLEDIRIDAFDRLLAINKAYTYTSVKVSAIYANGRIDPVAFENLTIGNLDNATAGEQTISVTYGGKEKNFTVKVLPVDSIIYVSGLATKIDINTDLNTSNVKVKVIYTDGTDDKITEEITEGITVTYDKAKPGNQTVTISALGKTTTTEIHTKAIDSIKITGGYASYVMSGDDINTANVVIKITYTDGEVKENAVPTRVSANNETGVITAAYTENGVTKSATATVAVLPVSSIVVNGLPDVVDYGADLGAMSITVTYSNGTYTDTKVFTGVTDATVSGFNKNSVGDQKVKVTYLGVTSKEYDVHVKGVTKIEIVGGTYDEKLMDGFDLDLSRLEIKVTYSNGDYLKGIQGTPDVLGASATWSQSGLVATISASLTFAGQNYTADPKTVEVLPINSVDALNGTIPGVLFDGDTLPMDKIALTVNYVIGQRESEPDANGNTEWYDVIASYLVHVGHKNLVIIGSGNDFDATTGKWGSSGTKMLTLVFKPQDTVTDSFGITTPKWMAVAKIEILAVEKIELVEGSMPTTVFQNENLDNASTTAQFRVEYTDGTYTYVTPSTPGFNMLIPENATANPGTAVIKVSYKNSATFDITITVVSSSGSANMIFGVEKPTSITARESYKQNFTNQNNVYVVGDDNPFIFRLSLLALGADGRPAYNPEYEGVSKVYVLDENGEVVGEAGDMVIINDAKGKNSFDFADSAIGKTFKIVTAPKDAPTMTVEQIVKVVDGYNIYDAKELNYITNYDEDLDGSNYKFYVDQNGNEYGQLTAVKNFLASKNMPYVNISAAVLHGNISVTEKDLPPEYFFTYTINGTEKKGLLDYLPIYNHQFTNPNGESFSIYGNYYSIYSYQLPCVIEKGFANNVDNFSDSELFLFRGRNEEAIMANATGRKHNINQANVIDTGFRDNDPNSNDQSASARHMLGLVGLKFRTCEGNVINTNVEAFYISLFADWDNLNLNITDSNIYNAWQGHLFIFNENYMGSEDTLPGDYYQNIQVNITNSLMGKCGGPVILSQQRNGYNPLDTANPSKNLQNIYSGADVTVDEKSNLYSYVTGQEAWFVAVGATPQAANIMMLDASLKEASGGEATFTSSEKIQGVSTMNLVMIVMNSGFAPDGTYATLNDSLTIAGDKTIELGENIGGGISNSELDMVYSQLGTSAFESPIFQTANKLPIDPNVINIIAQSDPDLAALLTDFNTTFVLNPFAVPTERINDVGKTIEGMLNSDPDLMAAVQNYLGMTQAYDHNEDLYKEGEYVSLYFGGLAVTLEYYHN